MENIRPVVKRIVCLANSRKMSGRCVAGREVLDTGPGSWIRPVSARPTQEVSEKERQYEDGTEPQVLDIIDVPLIKPQPHACQTENWLIDPCSRWTKVGRSDWFDLQQHVEYPATLWINGFSSSKGLNDRIPQDQADKLPNSLVLIHVSDLKLKVFAPKGSPPVVRADFEHRSIRYVLRVTDPVIERKYTDRGEETYHIDECCLCVSLAEPLDEYRYKLVAAVIG